MLDASTLWCTAGGGALGAWCRYQLGLWTIAWLGGDFPYGTLLVNVLGSFLMGVTVASIQVRLVAEFPWQYFIADGMLGALTTFSSFAWESFALLAKGDLLNGVLNILLNMVLCLMAVTAGVQLIQ